MKKLLGLLGSKPNPFLFLAPLNGTLAFNDRAGGGTLTGAGAVRYQAASGARTNLFTNPSFETNLTGWTQAGPAITNPSDATSGSKCIEIADTTTGQGIILNTAGMGKIASLAVHTISFDAWVTSGDLANWQVLVFGMGAAGDQLANAYNVNHTFTAVKTRYSFTVTPPAGSDKLKIYIRRAVATAGTLRLDAMVCETGTLTTAQATYFDGSTGGAWLDPITGILGTAHASPSVSQAAAWVEEGTTNTVPDPSFENATITNYWTAQGTAAISKVTTHAYISSNGGKVVCGAATTDGVHQLATSGAAASSGQSWTVSGRIRAFAAGDVGKTVKAAIIERTSGDAVVTTNLGSAITLTDAWQVFSYTVALSGGGTVAKATCGFMAGAAVAVDFVLDAVQLEQKAYATSYCDGSLGTGYAWSGTAHASSSTRTKCDISVTKISHINSDRGAVALRFTRDYDSGSSAYCMSAGNQNSVGADWIGFHILQGSPDALTCRVSHSNTGIVSGPASGSASALSTWIAGFGEWSSDSVGSAVGTDAIARVAVANAPVGWGSSSDITIGSSAFALHLNGGISNVAIFDRPLTASERARIVAAPLLDWRALDAA